MGLAVPYVTGYLSEHFADDDFRTLCDFAAEIQFERLGVFTYSAQEGTRAAGFPDDVPDAVKRARQDELVELQRRLGEVNGGVTQAMESLGKLGL